MSQYLHLRTRCRTSRAHLGGGWHIRRSTTYTLTLASDLGQILFGEDGVHSEGELRVGKGRHHVFAPR